jgi:hypothetical protein
VNFKKYKLVSVSGQWISKYNRIIHLYFSFYMVKWCLQRVKYKIFSSFTYTRPCTFYSSHQVLRRRLRNVYELFFFHWLYSPLGPWRMIFQFMIILQTVGLLERVISSSQGLYLNTEQHKYRINTYTYQTSMPCMGFEPTIPASERAKTIHWLSCETDLCLCVFHNVQTGSGGPLRGLFLWG